MREGTDTFTQGNIMQRARSRVGGMKMDQELVKKKKKISLVFGMPASARTHKHTVPRVAHGGPLATADSLWDVIKTGHHKWIG